MVIDAADIPLETYIALTNRIRKDKTRISVIGADFRSVPVGVEDVLTRPKEKSTKKESWKDPADHFSQPKHHLFVRVCPRLGILTLSPAGVVFKRRDRREGPSGSMQSAHQRFKKYRETRLPRRGGGFERLLLLRND
jgi:hypothetical protein